MIPRATYRIQFHSGFGFDRAAGLADYLADLGISHLYASPIGTARAGSTHGYDAIDPTRINPELGGEDGFRAMAAALRARGIGIIVDIVPNHMAVGGADNPWWLDVLAQGPASPHACFFDIDWYPADPALHGKLHAPFLGMPYWEALTSGALVLEADGSAIVAHRTHRFPIRAEDRAAFPADADLPALHDGRDPAGAERLHALLERQHYRLAWWRTAADEINWRRFFDITELAGLRIEDAHVFDTVHALPLRLYGEGLIDGLRIDHVDGLSDPTTYLQRLRGAMDTVRAEPGYLVVEKILAADERLPRDWRTDGTSGYDFMNEVAALLHDPAGEAPLNALWAQTSGRSPRFADEEHEARIEIIERTFPGQLGAVACAFHRLARADAATRDVTAGMIRRALTGLLVNFSAYRTYAGTAEDGGERLRRAADAARASAAPGEADIIDRLVGWIMHAGESKGAARDAARRFEQLSAPLAAKAVEDTAFYRYGRLLSRNDVGFDPARFAQSPATFLQRIAERARDYPHAMLATATHDHKRGEDVRARLAVLSEAPDEWAALLARFDAVGDGVDPGDRAMILQTIVGALPYDGLDGFAGRVADWSRKAVREAKLRSSWTAPDEAYEEACAGFIRAALDDATSRAAIAAFVDRIAPAGAINGLVQTLLRYTLPGVPDCYQGTDLWDLSLVDPDNRRPVDYAARFPVADWADAPTLLHDWRTGRVKQALIAAALALRRDKPALFAAPLRPLAVTGARADRIVAFAREAEGEALLVVAPLLCLSGARADSLALAPDWLGDTAVAFNDERLDVADLLGEAPIALRVR
ncbi:malto-oligosyltrehalose synthase [Sphingomonas nostoxanthinifaciens]|uniref:malto-oligosyltrehalose synthase n=1 Tax=Sphingomonas nostoxanthinifaciens TaxID=2872652 RepID=UPI001CC2056C|nr:malto-oligosyltrehalose synthase [Sphingomonas nostoxanthinifaciens]UAK23310.1 malto-oligosyltrehalose synthase [Sphingomonas nostoxanthinifaciens]